MEYSIPQNSKIFYKQKGTKSKSFVSRQHQLLATYNFPPVQAFKVFVSWEVCTICQCVSQQFYLNIVLIQKDSMSSVQIQDVEPTQVAGFIAKTFQILNNQDFAKISYWAPSGTEFIIKDINKFQQIVLPKYFRHNKMNSFIRQLNMYGFHKSRADHTKSVFSHPSFQRGRGDLLINIKRKIKDKTEQKNESALETPLKKRKEVQVNTATTKKMLETGNELNTIRQLGQSYNHLSFNLLGTKEKLKSIMNLNCSVNVLPNGNIGQMNLDDDIDELEDDQASIADKIEQKYQQQQRVVLGPSYKFVNPSCFFSSMRKSIN